ncbi:hypothetical protein QQP08_009678 [Theobroma cacao]|nr:hypothetical protein QQP08_009678 [Theobroma cacao]
MGSKLNEPLLSKYYIALSPESCYQATECSRLDNLGVGITTKGFIFFIIIPNLPDKSCSAPWGNFHSNACNNEAKVEYSIFSPRETPAHILLPEPNGMYRESFPKTSQVGILKDYPKHVGPCEWTRYLRRPWCPSVWYIYPQCSIGPDNGARAGAGAGATGRSPSRQHLGSAN